MLAGMAELARRRGPPKLYPVTVMVRLTREQAAEVDRIKGQGSRSRAIRELVDAQAHRVASKR